LGGASGRAIGTSDSVRDADGGEVVEGLPPGATTDEFAPKVLGIPAVRFFILLFFFCSVLFLFCFLFFCLYFPGILKSHIFFFLFLFHAHTNRRKLPAAKETC
jgi:hypothetical protein